MSRIQFGSFQVQSKIVLDLIQSVLAHRDKKYFVIVGDPGTGRTTMAQYINATVFNNISDVIFDDEVALPENLSQAIVTVTKESAYEVIKNFKSQLSMVIEMPPLIQRKADIVPFAQFFIQVLSLMNNKNSFKLTEKAAEKLLQHNWPGHFHELEIVLEEAFNNAQASESKNLIEPEHIILNVTPQGFEFSIGQKLDEVERKYILQTLYFVHQNRTRAAEILGISIRTLRNKINQYREEGFL